MSAQTVEIKHPYHDYCLTQAMELAAQIKAGPGVKPGAGLSVAEALKIVSEERRGMPHVWITGRVAEEVLRAANGETGCFTP